MKLTLMGADSAAVVGSTTMMSSPVVMGCVELSEIVSTETSNGTITNGTGFESAVGTPGFCTSMLSVPAVCTSDGFKDVAQIVADAHVVLRAAPFRRITEAELPLPATKFTP